jgi:hypothetical protein
VTSSVDPTGAIVAMDGLGIIGTIGFFVPAALLIALVVGAVVRDRRLHAREERLAQDVAANDRAASRRPGPPAG